MVHNEAVNPNVARLWNISGESDANSESGYSGSQFGNSGLQLSDSTTQLTASPNSQNPVHRPRPYRPARQSYHEAMETPPQFSARKPDMVPPPADGSGTKLNNNIPRGGKRPPSSSRPPPGNTRLSGSNWNNRSSKNSHGCTSTQDDFVYFSPSKPQAGLYTPSLASMEDDTDLNSVGKGNYANGEGRKCRDCMARVPYATLIATVMCCVGVGVFCGTMYRGTTLTLRLFEDVFKLHIKWVEPVQLTFMVVGAGMGGLGLMILFVGCLSTGDTRNKVYKTWRGRVGGRISCAIFMGITYLLSLAWLLMLICLVLVTVMYTLAWLQCQYIPENSCIDYNQFNFLFPSGTPEEDMRVCQGERKLFCKDYVNNAEISFILASVSAFLVILSLIHYLMCLASNYAHIKDQEKFMDLQEIQFLQESEMSTLPKDRF